METPNPERHVYASSSVDKHHPDRKVFGKTTKLCAQCCTVLWQYAMSSIQKHKGYDPENRDDEPRR